MENEAQVYDLQKEWRSMVLDKLSSLERGQNTLRDKVDSIREEFSTAAELGTLKNKVEILENFKYKLLGIFVGCQFFVGVVLFIIKK